MNSAAPVRERSSENVPEGKLGTQDGEAEFRAELEKELDLEAHNEAALANLAHADIERLRKDLTDGMPYARIFAELRVARLKSLVQRSAPASGAEPDSVGRGKLVSGLIDLELRDLDQLDAKSIELMVGRLSRSDSASDPSYEFLRQSWVDDANKATEQFRTLKLIRYGARIASLMIAGAYIVASIAVPTINNIITFLGEANPQFRITHEIVTVFGNLLGNATFWCAVSSFAGTVFSMMQPQQRPPSAAHWLVVRDYDRRVRLWLGVTVGLLVSVLGPFLLGNDTGKDVGHLIPIALAFGFSQDRFVRKLQSISA
jgi:hypothetical protein